MKANRTLGRSFLPQEPKSRHARRPVFVNIALNTPSLPTSTQITRKKNTVLGTRLPRECYHPGEQAGLREPDERDPPEDVHELRLELRLEIATLDDPGEAHALTGKQ